jgi:putative transport protein
LIANLIALIGVLFSGVVCLLMIRPANLNPGYSLGLFAGVGTSTPTLQAAITALGTDDPAVGYSVAYPFGVAGPILGLYLTFLVRKPRFEAAAGSGIELLEVAVRRAEHVGLRLGELTVLLPTGVHVAAIRRDDRTRPATPEDVIAEHDVLLVAGPTRAAVEAARDALGEAAPGHITHDRRDVDYLRVFASKPAVVGQALGNVKLPGGAASAVLHVRRGDADLLPRPDLVLEFGDRIGLLADRAEFPALRRFFGDSIKGTTEVGYVSVGLGMALGFLLGAIEIPIPGVGTIGLGLCGVLIVALVLGRYRRTAGLTWVLPASANVVLRNLGLTVFLAQVGMASGPKFASAVADTGFMLLGLSAIALLALVLPVLVLGFYVFKLPFDEVAGIVVGATGNPAILAYANRIAPTDKADLGYATIYPGMTVVKILFASIASAFL